ncbi:hypothetical protein F6X37_27915 [Paraburkholderia sp. 31.1]|nr:hypothetical protein [Paraburkholderia sp. 31.1]
MQGLFLGFAQLYNTLHLDSGAMGSPKLTKFKRVYQQHLSVELDGVNYAGTYRVMTGTVVVHFANESKFASYAPNRPETVARWLLTDLCRKAESRRRNAAKK